VYDLVETKEVKRLKENNRAVCSLAYHPKDACLITAGYDGIGMVWSDRGDD
jgi:WD40 repeat protein